MISNVQSLENIYKNGKEQEKIQAAKVEKLPEELRVETLKLEATKSGLETKMNEKKQFHDRAANIYNECNSIIQDLSKGVYNKAN